MVRTAVNEMAVESGTVAEEEVVVPDDPSSAPSKANDESSRAS